ncbi:VanZ family protein [Brachybacterium sp. YJGR34]|uniref:VanZ family protein n=1 Tax=Brachybacterium sp. YJGR34 TaxID=2059911 RepID=UPI000E0C84D2|nr:VanZ family protein [Brachybacterium sp. YJGR34]
MAPRPSERAERLPWPLTVLAAVVLVGMPIAAGALLLTADGWSVNRANVLVWNAVAGTLGLRGAITPEQFAVVANVLLFVPFFAALALLVPRWWWVVLGAALSAAVELHQGTLGSREASLGDVAANTAGAAIGVALGLGVRRRALRAAAAGPSARTTPGGALDGSASGPGGGSDDRD